MNETTRNQILNPPADLVRASHVPATVFPDGPLGLEDHLLDYNATNPATLPPAAATLTTVLLSVLESLVLDPMRALQFASQPTKQVQIMSFVNLLQGVLTGKVDPAREYTAYELSLALRRYEALGITEEEYVNAYGPEALAKLGPEPEAPGQYL